MHLFLVQEFLTRSQVPLNLPFQHLLLLILPRELFHSNLSLFLTHFLKPNSDFIGIKYLTLLFLANEMPRQIQLNLYKLELLPALILLQFYIIVFPSQSVPKFVVPVLIKTHHHLLKFNLEQLTHF